MLEDGEPIGRIYESREKRPGLEWYWSITSDRNHNGRHTVKTSDYDAGSLEDAKNAFRKNWDRKAWRPD